MNVLRTLPIHGICLLQSVLALLCLALQPVSAADTGPYDVRIEQVDAGEFPLVTLYVTVTEPSSGEIISGLKQEQFFITEDGQSVEIVRFSAGNPGPISTVLAIDRSGSMSDEGKLVGAKQAAHAFVDEMRPQDQVALVVFDSRVTTWQNFSTDQDLLHRRIDALAANGGTAWHDSVWYTVDLMSGVTGRRNAILLSDGMDESSSRSLSSTIRHAREMEVAIHAISLGNRVDRRNLQRMADETGGTYHHSPRADQLRALYESFAENAQREYVITVRSDRASYDGTRRGLQVTVGGSTGSGGYVEQHLLNVESSPWVALAFIAPLALAFIVPLVWRKTHAGPPVPSWSLQVDPPPQAPTAICAHCGRSIRTGARFCAGCGSAASSALASSSPVNVPSPTAVCSRCGQLLRPHARFCSQCGQRSPR